MNFSQHNYAPKRIFHNLIFELDQFNNHTNNGKMKKNPKTIVCLFFLWFHFLFRWLVCSLWLRLTRATHCTVRNIEIFSVWYLLMSRLYCNTAECYTDELIAPEIIHKHRNDGGWQKYTACLSACASIHVKRKLGNISTKACPMFCCAAKTEKKYTVLTVLVLFALDFYKPPLSLSLSFSYRSVSFHLIIIIITFFFLL